MLSKKKRVKTGCITCKIRQVKCDEQKPSCLRCQSTGRTCDGYSADSARRVRATTVPKPKSSSISNMPRTLLPILPGDKEERRYFAFFRSRITPDFGTYDAGFWDGLLLQISHAEPAVHHAVVALASLHEAFNGSTEFKPGSDQYSLKQYNKSVAGLHKYISTANDKSVEVVLICCILFTFFESLHGDYNSAGQHLQGGLKILSSLQEDPHSSKALHVDIVPILLRLRIQARPFIDTELTLDHPSTLAVCLPKRFSSLGEARNKFYTIMSLVLDFCRFKLLALHKPEIQSGDHSETLLEQQVHCVLLVEQWQVEFDDLLSQLSLSMNSKDRVGANLLKLHHATIATILDYTLTFLECKSDRLLPKFQKIVSLAKSLIEDIAETGMSLRRQILWVDVGFKAPLFFVATKCRDPLLRREAACLISSPGREGTWHSRVAAIIAKRVVEIEEEGLPYVNMAHDVPESSRIYLLRPRQIDLVKQQVKIVVQQYTKYAGKTSTFEECLKW